MNDKYKQIVGTSVMAATNFEPLQISRGPSNPGKISSIWASMLLAIAETSGRALDSSFADQFIQNLEPKAAEYYWDCKLTTWCFHLIPGGTTLAALGISAMMNALFTYKFGASVSKLIEHGIFDLSDATKAAQDVLDLMCTTPTFNDVKGTIELAQAV